MANEKNEIKRQREKSERFEIAFNQIHTELKKLGNNGDTDHFVELLHKVKNRHAPIRRYFDDLKSYARLRNALVHEKSRKNFYIAEPHIEVVEQIESIAEFLSVPPSILTVASKPVKTFQADGDVSEAILEMDKYEYTQYPVYDGDQFKFLMTESGLRKYFSSRLKEASIDLSGQKIADVQKYEKTNTVKIVSKDMNIFELEDLYESRTESENKLEAVIITENGSHKEKPVGIVSSWDLIKMETD
jgi:CBS domain-containing protein